jgi:hypothetical protein
MGLTIGIEPERNDGVSMFVPTSEPFDRSANNDSQDFRWSIDLEKLDPAQPPMILERSGISPGVTINDGIFFSARLTDPSKIEVNLLEENAASRPFNRVAGIIGSNIYLQPGEKVVLRWFADGRKQSLELPKTEDNTTIVIYIDNSPSLMTGTPTHSEFVEYFKVVTNVSRRFDIDFNEIGPPHTTNTDSAPCMPVTVGGGGGNG